MTDELKSVRDRVLSTNKAEILLEENDFLIVKWLCLNEMYELVAYPYGKTGMANNEPWSREITYEQVQFFLENTNEAIKYFESKHHYFHTEVKCVSFSDITNINENGLMFRNFHWITYRECSYNFKRAYPASDLKCIGERDITANPPYVELYSTYAHDRILFDKKGQFAKDKNINDFNEFVKQLSDFGYITYDLS